MNVFMESLGTIAPWHDQLTVLRQCAANDVRRRHAVVTTRDEAELILTVLHSNPFVSRVDGDARRFVYSSHDIGFPFHPGIYPSLCSWNQHPAYARSGPYLPKPWDLAGAELPTGEPRNLYSFVGSAATSPVRDAVMKLRHPRGLVRDTSRDDAYKSNQPQATYQRFQREYLSTLFDSQFILCPRGVGVASVRLFETMRAGRVPVVISDHWSPPAGIPWNDCIVRVAEKDIPAIPAQLEQLARQARSMGECAREQWQLHFGEDTVFDWLIEQCVAMRGPGSRHPTAFRAWKVMKLFSPGNLRSVGAPWLRALIRPPP